mmetsp:Transcript_577/g.1802  ORF Transcript_577/g.1802 Transcript_577/m.1802 type:complete len:273 (+) Transcript_577:992-1810(+)
MHLSRRGAARVALVAPRQSLEDATGVGGGAGLAQVSQAVWVGLAQVEGLFCPPCGHRRSRSAVEGVLPHLHPVLVELGPASQQQQAHLSRAIGGLEERGEGVVLAVRRPRRGRSSVVVAAAAFVPGRSLLRLGQLKALVKQAPRDSDSASRQLRLDAGACQELPPHEGVDALVAPGRVLRDRQELARPFGPSRIQEQRQNRASHQLVLRPALGRHETSLLIEEDEEREQGLRGGGFRYVSPDLVACVDVGRRGRIAVPAGVLRSRACRTPPV